MSSNTHKNRKRVKANNKFATDDYEYVGGTVRKNSSESTELTIEVSITISLK